MDIRQRSQLNRDASSKLVSWLERQVGFAWVTVANDDRGSLVHTAGTDGSVRTFLVADRPLDELAGLDELRLIAPNLTILESVDVDSLTES